MLSTNGPLENTYFTWWQPNFFNKSVQRAFALGGADNFAQGSVGTVTRDLASGRLLGLDGVRYLVMLDTDTRFGFPQRPVNPGGELLIIPTPTDQLLYATRGVRDTGALGWGSHPLVRVFDHTGRPVVRRRDLGHQGHRAGDRLPVPGGGRPGRMRRHRSRRSRLPAARCCASARGWRSPPAAMPISR